MTTESQFMRLILDYLDHHKVSERAFSLNIGVSVGTVYAWRTRGLTQLPKKRHIEAVARQIGVPYDTVLHAALADTGYTQDDVRHSPDWDDTTSNAGVGR